MDENIVYLKIAGFLLLLTAGAAMLLGAKQPYRFAITLSFACCLVLAFGEYSFVGAALVALIILVALPVVIHILLEIIKRYAWAQVRRKFPDQPSIPPGSPERISDIYKFIWMIED